MSVIISIFLWLLMGAAASYMATQRGRDPLIWFAIGMLLGILGLLILVLLPSLNSEGRSDVKPELSTDEPKVQLLSPSSSEPIIEKDFMIKEWFCLDKARQQQGPMRFDALKSLWGEGKIDNFSFVWCEGMENWKRIQELPDLDEALSID